MTTNVNDDKVYVIPYGRYLGVHNEKSIIQTSPRDYREADQKWDGVIKAIAEAPTLSQFKQTLTRAGVTDTKAYIENLIANDMMTLLDGSSEDINLFPIYEWSLYPTLNYKGRSKSPAITDMIQIMVTTPATKMPFNISLLTTSILAEGLDNELILGSVAPKILTEFTQSSLSEPELKEIFVSDLRKLFQRKGAFLG